MRNTMLDHPGDADRIIKEHQRHVRSSVENNRLSQQMLSRQQQQPTNIRIVGTWLFLGAGMLIIAGMAWLLI